MTANFVAVSDYTTEVFAYTYDNRLEVWREAEFSASKLRSFSGITDFVPLFDQPVRVHKPLRTTAHD